MSRHLAIVLSIAAALSAASPAFACGEGIFHMGGGLRYQGYLAPRPATVLVFDDNRTPRAEKIAFYRGLVQAGHQLSIAHNADELTQAMQQRRYDVVIADFSELGVVGSAAPSAARTPKLLPVVQRSQRDAPDLRSQFEVFALDGASLGQYLKLINRLMKG